jgi:dihydroorotase
MRVWEMPNACVSPGWMDIGAQGCDPGFEHREDLHSLAAAAAAGGFTAVACLPNTKPALHSKSEILYVKNKTAAGPVDVYPIGAVSVNCEGKDLAELYDMHAAGAVAFSDGAAPVQDAGLLLRALQYARAFNGLIINDPRHKTLSASGQMHEGLVSTSLGLKGIPALAESITVQRDLSLLEYAEGRLHLHLVSTAKSVALIRAAKKASLSVSCSVAAANLCFTDEQLGGFDSNWKVMPPLRSRTDIEALQEGLIDGTIDFICSNHTPWDEEAKNLEFPYASFGMTGLETAFAMCRTHTPLTTELLIEKFSAGPRAVLQMPVPEIKTGSPASLTLFDPDASWIFTDNNLRSRSRNTPFLDQPLKGRVLGIVNKNRLIE